MTQLPFDDGPVWENKAYDDDAVTDEVPHLTAIEWGNETPYKKHLIGLLEAYDWDVTTEVWDDDSQGRIDIVAEHPAVGCVAIEVKRTYRYTGHTVANGIGQILNYRSYTYSDYDIDYWALAPGFDTGSGPNGFKHVRNMFRRTLVELKLGMVSRRREAICFGKKRDLGIPLRDPETFSADDRRQINETIRDREWNVSEYDPSDA